jgi:hypothetical protein
MNQTCTSTYVYPIQSNIVTLYSDLIYLLQAGQLLNTNRLVKGIYVIVLATVTTIKYCALCLPISTIHLELLIEHGALWTQVNVFEYQSIMAWNVVNPV